MQGAAGKTNLHLPPNTRITFPDIVDEYPGSITNQGKKVTTVFNECVGVMFKHNNFYGDFLRRSGSLNGANVSIISTGNPDFVCL